MTSIPSPAPTAGAIVRFVELAGADAAHVLRSLATSWRRTGAAVELLTSSDHADLWLLVARGGDPATDPDAPVGARVWRFESVAP